MPSNLEEKEKCVEKQTRMKKYIPFLDFMINKLEKKNNEVLQCQFKKFHSLRSIISEGKGKTSLHSLNKIEEVILKLITILDYKEQNNPQLKELTVGSPKNSEELSVEIESNDSSSNSMIPSSTTTTILVTNASSLPQVVTVDSRPRALPTTTVDLLVHTLKMSINSRENLNNTDNSIQTDKKVVPELESLNQESNQGSASSSICKKTNFEKNVDNDKLAGNINLPESGSNNNNVVGSSTKDSEKVPGQLDLLFSSRQKLFDLVQKKLNLSKVNYNSLKCEKNIVEESKTEKKSDSQSISALYSSKDNLSPTADKTVSDCVQTIQCRKQENSVPENQSKKNLINEEKQVNATINEKKKFDSSVRKSFSHDLSKSFISSCPAEENKAYEEKYYPGNFETKQKLKEKLIADINEIYRIPGKSVGGSLRVKKNKNFQKEVVQIQDGKEFFISDKLTKSHGHSISKFEVKDKTFNEILTTNHCSFIDKRLPNINEKEIKTCNALLKQNGNEKHEIDNFMFKKSFESQAKNTLEKKKEVRNYLNEHFDEKNSIFQTGLSSSDAKDFVQNVSESKNSLSNFSFLNKSKEVKSKFFNDSDFFVISNVSEGSKQHNNGSADEKLDKVEPFANSNNKRIVNSDYCEKVANVKSKIEEKSQHFTENVCNGNIGKIREGSTLEIKSSDRLEYRKTVEKNTSVKTSTFQNPSCLNEMDEKIKKQIPETSVKVNFGNMFDKKGLHNRVTNRLPLGMKQSFMNGDILPSNLFITSPLKSFPENSRILNFNSFFDQSRSKQPKSYKEYKLLKSMNRKKDEVIKNLTSNNTSARGGINNHVNVEKKLASTVLTNDLKSSSYSKTNLRKSKSELKHREEKRFNKKNFDKCNAKKEERSIVNKRRPSSPENSTSPLEELYTNENLSKTGRGYGLQNFKIPKKQNVSRNTIKPKPNETKLAAKNKSLAQDFKRITEMETDLTKDGENRKQKTSEIQISNNEKDTTSSAAFSNSACKKKPEENIHDIILTKKCISAEDKNDTVTSNEIVEPTNPVFENQVFQTIIQQIELNPLTSTAQLKNEIALEFLKAFIKNCFQSEEGKLLLTNTKLLDEVASNPRILKSVQKLVNSAKNINCFDSDSSSVKSEESEKIETKNVNKKKKKKAKTYRRLRICSSSSSSECNFDTKSEVSEKIEGENDLNSNCKSTTTHRNENLNVELVDLKETMNEKLPTESQEDSTTSSKRNNSKNTKKIREMKSTTSKRKGRIKNELDRLHEGIRNMFISSDFTSVTGGRMCRLSTGSSNNYPLSNFEAKRKRFKRVIIYPNDEYAGSDSEISVVSRKEESFSKTRKIKSLGPIVSAENSKKKPYVLLHKLDLNSYQLRKEVKEECCKFEGEKGRNVACRSKSSKICESTRNPFLSDFSDCSAFLKRNLRKSLRLKSKTFKAIRKRKSLSDIVQYLPLKMARIKHLPIGEREKRTNEEQNAVPNFVRTQRKQPEKKCCSSDNQAFGFISKEEPSMCQSKSCSLSDENVIERNKIKNSNSKVLASKLSKEEAADAIKDSKENNYYVGSLEQACSLEIIKNRVKSKLSKTANYICRICRGYKTLDYDSFFSHVSFHTGELRFMCPVKGCTVKGPTMETIQSHVTKKHYENTEGSRSKILELFPVPDERGTLLGYLCSECNYVQVFMENVEDHVQRVHSTEKKVVIIKIDMSRKEFEDHSFILKKPTVNKESLLKCESSSWRKNLEPVDEHNITRKRKIVFKTEKINCKTKKKKVINLREDSIVNTNSKENNTKMNMCDSGSNRNDSNKFENSEPLGKEGSAKDKELPENIVMGDFVKEIEVVEDESSLCTLNKVLGSSENLKDLTSSSRRELNNSIQSNDLLPSAIGIAEEKIIQSDFIGPKLKENISVEEVKIRNETPIERDVTLPKIKLENTLSENVFNFGKNDCVQKIKIGPLEVHITGKTVILYECFIKGCLFSSKSFDSYEKHAQIAHPFFKWSGTCELCSENVSQVPHLMSLNPTSVLDHLKQHKVINPYNCPNQEVFEKETPSSKATETAISSAPSVPRLRVRNLFGDRLSTPKETSKEFLVNKGSTVSQQLGNEQKEDEPLMLSIENVRSLQSENFLSESNLLAQELPFTTFSNTENNRMSTKPVVVRSCPTPKIALRPDSSALKIQVGHLTMSNPSNPVVLSSLSTSTPIRIVQPLIVSASTPILANSKSVPVILPVSPSSLDIPVPTTIEAMINSQKPTEAESSRKDSKSNQSLEDLLLSGTSEDDKSLTKHSCSKTHRLSRSDSAPICDAEEKGEPKSKTANGLQKLTAGNKTVKDIKIYKEMLTKKKLCHLFKCMAVECSFTCNNENIFTQHIGLHEAQRRMKNHKTWKNICIDSNYKLRRVFNWQQCAYCCEVLTNTSVALSKHITLEHGHCIYQCAFCFYRAVSQSYVEIHQNLAHEEILKNRARVIYKCKPFSRAPLASAALEKQGKRQSVRPYHCDQCGNKFYITQEFMNHLMKEHQSVTAYTCHICKNLCFKADRLIAHYKLHSYCTYQCAYCLHGTETEREMVFHLCNFHFSQPAYMYVRALADNQKSTGSQLDSLKVILYESDTLSPDCIVEVDLEDATEDDNNTAETHELSDIVAELGINTEMSSAPEVSPIIKELANIGDESSKSLSVKTLLPNAQFSSEQDNPPSETFSYLISSGSNSGSRKNEDSEITVPLGQMNVEAVSAQNTLSPPLSSETVAAPDKKLKLNEIIVNLQQKEKTDTSFVASAGNVDGNSNNKPTIASAVHKMPPVILSRKSAPKNVYIKKPSAVQKKPESSVQACENFVDENHQTTQISSCKSYVLLPAHNTDVPVSNLTSDIVSSASSLREDDSAVPQPVITSVVSLSSNAIGASSSNLITEIPDSLCKISDVHSLSSAVTHPTKNDDIFINVESEVKNRSLKPPIIRVEDFVLKGGIQKSLNLKNYSEKNLVDSKLEAPYSNETHSTESPDIIVLEESKPKKNVETVTLDSEEEDKIIECDKASSKLLDSNIQGEPLGDEIIHNEIELLRNQIVCETDSLLFDDTTTKILNKSLPEVQLTIDHREMPLNSESLLSPIEEAICSLNKKLEEEGGKQKKENPNNDCKKLEEIKTLPRTRSSAKEKAKRGEFRENSENDSDDFNVGITGETKKVASKCMEGLVGKNLYICGNEKCRSAAEDEIKLKNHWQTCSFSQELLNLVCPHCNKQMKQFHQYLEHLKYHGEKKYFCGLCTFKSAVEHSVTRHVKQKHKCSQLRSVSADLPTEGGVTFYPKNYKTEKQDFESSGYSPGDEDKLPLQAVYQVNVKCAKCPYFTKVRSNMVRHLKIHLKYVETEGFVVPSTAPTNPVPCLDTKERMFDKMTNLAASSQLATKDKTTAETLAPEEEAKLPQFIAEQLRYKCCMPDCNYITVDEGMLRHHIKALHHEISYYSCPHCRSTVHVDVRHVILDKIGHHLKHHDAKLYKCAYCIYFHYQKAVVEKHTLEKHPDRRYFVYTVREPKGESAPTEEQTLPELSSKMWKCGICSDFQSFSKVCVLEHLAKTHSTKSKYKCSLCNMKSNHYHSFFAHFASKHSGEKVSYIRTLVQVNSSSVECSPLSGDSSDHFDTTPLWQRGATKVRHIRGILIEEEEIKTKKVKKVEEKEETKGIIEPSEIAAPGNSFYCPLCSDKKVFYTRSTDCFRSHLFTELNYQQFACMICGKMFVDKKDFEKHHLKTHPDKPQSMKQTKEDGEITQWVDKLINKQREEMEKKKRRASLEDSSDGQGPSKKKKKCD